MRLTCTLAGGPKTACTSLCMTKTMRGARAETPRCAFSISPISKARYLRDRGRALRQPWTTTAMRAATGTSCRTILAGLPCWTSRIRANPYRRAISTLTPPTIQRISRVLGASFRSFRAETSSSATSAAGCTYLATAPVCRSTARSVSRLHPSGAKRETTCRFRWFAPTE